MFDKYLVTGATGFLGRTIVEELVRRGSSVRALVLHGDPCTKLLPPEAATVVGDERDRAALAEVVAGAAAGRRDVVLIPLGTGGGGGIIIGGKI